MSEVPLYEVGLRGGLARRDIRSENTRTKLTYICDTARMTNTGHRLLDIDAISPGSQTYDIARLTYVRYRKVYIYTTSPDRHIYDIAHLT